MAQCFACDDKKKTKIEKTINGQMNFKKKKGKNKKPPPQWSFIKKNGFFKIIFFINIMCCGSRISRSWSFGSSTGKSNFYFSRTGGWRGCQSMIFSSRIRK